MDVTMARWYKEEKNLIIVINEKSKDSTNSIKILLTKIIAENIPNIEKNIHVEGTYKNPNNQNQNITSLHYIILKILEVQNNRKF